MNQITSTTTTTVTLTPAQFQIARAFARAYGHLWSKVPDGTYTPETIQQWVDENLVYPGMIAGIDSPTLVSEGGELSNFFDVIHSTQTGRLTWKVTSFGNVQLIVTRPGDIQVANVWLLNNNQENVIAEDEIEFSFSVGNHVLAIQLEATEDDNIHEELLFLRHVDALVRPIVAVLTLKQQQAYDKDIVEMSREDAQSAYEDFRLRVIEPAIAQAKAWLAPLYELAMPDPYFDGAITFDEIESACRGEQRFGSLREQEPNYTIPETFYVRERLGAIYNTSRMFPLLETVRAEGQRWAVFHHKEWFPVQSEQVAVHATMLLLRNSDMSLFQAIKAAIIAETYRPE